MNIPINFELIGKECAECKDFSPIVETMYGDNKRVIVIKTCERIGTCRRILDQFNIIK